MESPGEQRSRTLGVLGSAFVLGILLHAGLSSIFTAAHGDFKTVLLQKRRLVLLVFFSSISIFALAQFIVLLFVNRLPCQIAVIFSSTIDQVARVSGLGLILWNIVSDLHNRRAEKVGILALLGLRAALGAVVIGFSGAIFDPVCFVAPRNDIPAILQIGLDGLLVSYTLIRIAFTLRLLKGKESGRMKAVSANNQRPRLPLIALAYGGWWAGSFPFLLGRGSIFLRVFLLSLTLLFLVSILRIFRTVTFSASLGQKDNTTIRQVDSDNCSEDPQAPAAGARVSPDGSPVFTPRPGDIESNKTKNKSNTKPSGGSGSNREENRDSNIVFGSIIGVPTAGGGGTQPWTLTSDTQTSRGISLATSNGKRKSPIGSILPSIKTVLSKPITMIGGVEQPSISGLSMNPELPTNPTVKSFRQKTAVELERLRIEEEYGHSQAMSDETMGGELTPAVITNSLPLNISIDIGTTEKTASVRKKPLKKDTFRPNSPQINKQRTQEYFAQYTVGYNNEIQSQSDRGFSDSAYTGFTEADKNEYSDSLTFSLAPAPQVASLYFGLGILQHSPLSNPISEKHESVLLINQVAYDDPALMRTLTSPDSIERGQINPSMGLTTSASRWDETSTITRRSPSDKIPQLLTSPRDRLESPGPPLTPIMERKKTVTSRSRSLFPRSNLPEAMPKRKFSLYKSPSNPDDRRHLPSTSLSPQSILPSREASAPEAIAQEVQSSGPPVPQPFFGLGMKPSVCLSETGFSEIDVTLFPLPPPQGLEKLQHSISPTLSPSTFKPPPAAANSSECMSDTPTGLNETFQAQVANLQRQAPVVIDLRAKQRQKNRNSSIGTASTSGGVNIPDSLHTEELSVENLDPRNVDTPALGLSSAPELIEYECGSNFDDQGESEKTESEAEDMIESDGRDYSTDEAEEYSVQSPSSDDVVINSGSETDYHLGLEVPRRSSVMMDILSAKEEVLSSKIKEDRSSPKLSVAASVSQLHAAAMFSAQRHFKLGDPIPTFSASRKKYGSKRKSPPSPIGFLLKQRRISRSSSKPKSREKESSRIEDKLALMAHTKANDRVDIKKLLRNLPASRKRDTLKDADFLLERLTKEMDQQNDEWVSLHNKLERNSLDDISATIGPMVANEFSTASRISKGQSGTFSIRRTNFNTSKETISLPLDITFDDVEISPISEFSAAAPNRRSYQTLNTNTFFMEPVAECLISGEITVFESTSEPDISPVAGEFSSDSSNLQIIEDYELESTTTKPETTCPIVENCPIISSSSTSPAEPHLKSVGNFSHKSHALTSSLLWAPKTPIPASSHVNALWHSENRETQVSSVTLLGLSLRPRQRKTRESLTITTMSLWTTPRKVTNDPSSKIGLWSFRLNKFHLWSPHHLSVSESLPRQQGLWRSAHLLPEQEQTLSLSCLVHYRQADTLLPVPRQPTGSNKLWSMAAYIDGVTTSVASHKYQEAGLWRPKEKKRWGIENSFWTGGENTPCQTKTAKEKEQADTEFVCIEKLKGADVIVGPSTTADCALPSPSVCTAEHIEYAESGNCTSEVLSNSSKSDTSSSIGYGYNRNLGLDNGVSSPWGAQQTPITREPAPASYGAMLLSYIPYSRRTQNYLASLEAIAEESESATPIQLDNLVPVMSGMEAEIHIELPEIPKSLAFSTFSLISPSDEEEESSEYVHSDSQEQYDETLDGVSTGSSYENSVASSLLWNKATASRTTNAMPEPLATRSRVFDGQIEAASGPLWSYDSMKKSTPHLWQRSFYTLPTIVKTPLWNKTTASRTTRAVLLNRLSDAKKREFEREVGISSGPLWSLNAAKKCKPQLWQRPPFTLPETVKTPLWNKTTVLRTTKAIAVSLSMNKRIFNGNNGELERIGGPLWSLDASKKRNAHLWQRPSHSFPIISRTTLWDKTTAARTTKAVIEPFTSRKKRLNCAVEVASGPMWTKGQNKAKPSLWKRPICTLPMCLKTPLWNKTTAVRATRAIPEVFCGRKRFDYSDLAIFSGELWRKEEDIARVALWQRLSHHLPTIVKTHLWNKALASRNTRARAIGHYYTGKKRYYESTECVRFTGGLWAQKSEAVPKASNHPGITEEYLAAVSEFLELIVIENDLETPDLPPEPVAPYPQFEIVELEPTTSKPSSLIATKSAKTEPSYFLWRKPEIKLVPSTASPLWSPANAFRTTAAEPATTGPERRPLPVDLALVEVSGNLWQKSTENEKGLWQKPVNTLSCILEPSSPLWNKHLAKRTTNLKPESISGKPRFTDVLSSRVFGQMWTTKPAHLAPALWKQSIKTVINCTSTPFNKKTHLWCKETASRTTNLRPEQMVLKVHCDAEIPLAKASGSLWQPEGEVAKLWQRPLKTISTYTSTQFNKNTLLWSKDTASRTTALRPEPTTFKSVADAEISLAEVSGSLWQPEREVPRLWQRPIKTLASYTSAPFNKKILLWSKETASRTTSIQPEPITFRSKASVEIPLTNVSGSLWKPERGVLKLWRRPVKTVASYTSNPLNQKTSLWRKETASRDTSLAPARIALKVYRRQSPPHFAVSGQLWEGKTPRSSCWQRPLKTVLVPQTCALPSYLGTSAGPLYALVTGFVSH